jgi:PAS domain S-box-containing protein
MVEVLAFGGRYPYGTVARSVMNLAQDQPNGGLRDRVMSQRIEVAPQLGAVQAPAGDEGRQASAIVERPWRRDPIVWLIGLLGVFVGCYTLWWVARLGDTSLTDRFTGVAAAPGGLLALAMCVRLGRADRLDTKTRQAWSLVGVAIVIYGLGAALHVAGSATSSLAVYAPVAIALEIAAYPVAWLALAALPWTNRTFDNAVLFSLDVSIVAWSAAILIWHFLFYPVGRDAGSDYLATFAAAAFPVGDMSLVFALGAIVLYSQRTATQAALAVAAVAFVAVFLGDMVSGFEGLQRDYVPGGVSGLLYSGACVGIAAAAYVQWGAPDRDRGTRGLADYSRSIPWLAYAAVAVAFVAPTLRDWNDPDPLRQHLPATGFLMTLVVARLVFTARENARLATAERARLVAAVDQAAEAMIITDGSGHVTYVNPAFTRITGYQSAEAMGRDVGFLTEGADSARLAEMRANLGRGESWEGRIVAQRRDGAEVEVTMAIAPLRDTTGAISGAVAVARDISHERALEAQLAHAQRMEAVGRLAGGIAHDFNNILTAISGFGELASAELPAGDPVAEDIGEILKASDRAAALTRALLAFSRRQVMEPTKVDLNDVVGDLKPMLGLLLGEDIELVVEPDPELGLALIDRGQLEQVILNLAVNARDAMPDGGKLTIATANTDIDARRALSSVGAVQGSFVKLVFSDTGSGMTPEVIEHAFEPFFTTKPREKGTGLGLSTVIGVVQQSGGTVSVASSPGGGSVFTILLPRVGGTREAHYAAGLSNPTPGGTETILVAEDEEAVRLYVERILSRAGYRVLAAANGPEALAIARTLPHLDLLFTDMVMPGMGGPELVDLLIAAQPSVRVLYASGYSDDALAEGFGSEGQVSILTKPFGADLLLARIREVLDGRPGRPANRPVAPASTESP